MGGTVRIEEVLDAELAPRFVILRGQVAVRNAIAMAVIDRLAAVELVTRIARGIRQSRQPEPVAEDREGREA